MNDFWTEIKQKLQELKELDLEFKLVFGSVKHRYEILPPASHSEIEAYETIHGVQLPDEYRSYLQYFGAGGCGPEGGILKFPEKIWPGDLAKPLQQEFIKRNEPTEGLTSSIKNSDGMMQIGIWPVGEHRQFLVVNGSLRGHVVYTDVYDTLYVSAPFDKWYERWVDCALIGVRQFEEMKKIEVGDHFDRLLKNDKLLITDIESNRFGLKYTKGSIELDANRRVTRVNLKQKYAPAGNSGFASWPYNSLT